ncbi:unnamed protein product [marine sediment metagenome]|uniref:Cytidyltransferase-like domain-containing protein n=1 Tax=marine sediment metagenome TaxID=412755 RepID=X1MQQ8_9ZZZZ
MKIGILGGTFDPVHLGHLLVAEEVRIRLGLNEILFVPAGQPWLKIDHATIIYGYKKIATEMCINSKLCRQISEVKEKSRTNKASMRKR